jgi:hypothetical protein
MAPRVCPETEEFVTVLQEVWRLIACMNSQAILFRSVVDLESRVLATLPLEDDF